IPRDVVEKLYTTISQPFLVGGLDRVRIVAVQRRFEEIVVMAFAKFVDELGFRVPGDHLPGRLSSLPITYDIPQFEDPRRPFHPAVALAQHHGMPTRLLDWTGEPLVAAFFATEGADPDQDGEIAVWAFDVRSDQ